MTKLKQLLTDRRIRQVELARELRLDPSQLSLYFSGWKRIPEKHLGAIGRVLGLKVTELSELIKDGRAI